MKRSDKLGRNKARTVKECVCVCVCVRAKSEKECKIRKRRSEREGEGEMRAVEDVELKS